MSDSILPDMDLLRQHCSDEAFKTFATAAIFERRLWWPKFGLDAITYTGLAVPLLVGGVALSFGLKDRALPVLLWIGGVVLVTQLLLSLGALVFAWTAKVEYYKLSMVDNYRLSRRFQELAKRGGGGLESIVALLDAENASRTETDLRMSPSQAEKRYGMRAGLRHFQRSCAGCRLVPLSLSPGDCPICGSFPRRYAS
ncbi:MAG: hypothetical protein R2910_05505 [Gemmatimonadales bacterium]